jgi:hypothetical protein
MRPSHPKRAYGAAVVLFLVLFLFFGAFDRAGAPSTGGPSHAAAQEDETATEIPPEIPTETPTDIPTEIPTEIPTDIPTEIPTDIPTDIPTATDTPVEVPTDTPVPTEAPTATSTPAPTPGQITITLHLCPSTIENKEGFNALGGFEQQMAACPSILLPGNTPVAGAVGGSEASFDLTMATGAGDTAQNQTLATSIFTPGARCETDAGFDLDRDGQLATCFDLSGYNLQYAALGSLMIALGPLPPDTRLGAAGFIPNSGDEHTLKRTTKEGTIELDTTGDDNVRLNVFLFSKAPTPTPVPATATATPKPTQTPTSTPSPTPQASGSGTLQAIALYCTADIDATTLTVLPPGEQAEGAELGDSTCVGGNASFDLYSSGNYVASISTGVPGVNFLSDLPAGSYTIADQKSGATADATIADGVTTRSILLSYAATVGDGGSGGLITDDGGTGDASGPSISVGGGLVNDGGISVSGGDGSGGPLIVQDNDSGDTESVTGLVQTGSGAASNAINLALPLAGFCVLLLLAGLRYSQSERLRRRKA